MKLLIKQRVFSWFDSYDVYNEDGSVAFVVKGELSWGHRLNIYDPFGNHIGTVQEKVFTLLARFEMYLKNEMIGEIRKEFTFFKPQFTLDCQGLNVQGDFFGWDYQITDNSGRIVSSVSKELFHWSDTYVIDVSNSFSPIIALMIVLAIDAENCSNG